MIQHQLQRYAHHKNSSIELVQEIPENWSVLRVKDVVTKIGNGVTPRGGSEIYQEEGIPFLRSQNVHDEGLELSSVSFIPPAIHAEMKNSQLKAGDILFNITGASIGRTCIVPQEFGEANISQHVVFLRIKSTFNKAYISLFLKSDLVKKYVRFEQNGASKEAFTLSQISTIPLVFPEPKEQQAVADYLDAKTKQIDRKIELLEQKAEKYVDLEQALINETVTRGLDKSVPMKDSGVDWIGQIPAHWDVSAITKITKVVSIKDHPNEELLSVYRDYGVIIKSHRDDNHNKAGENLAGYKLVVPGFLVINKMKAWQGSLGVSNYRGIVSPAYITCKVSKNIERRYLHHLLRCRTYIDEYNRLSYGVRNDQWDMRYDDFKYIPVLLPSLDEQKRIADYLDEKLLQINRIVETIYLEIEKLKELRKSLINDVVTGKIKVYQA